MNEPSNTAELIAEARGLARSLATRIYRNLPVRVELEDLIAYGELGLAEAAREYDPEQGTQFSTFAYYRIRGAIYDGVAKMTWTSRARYRRLQYEQMANQVLENEKEDGANDGPGEWFARTTQKLAVVYLASGMDSENDPLQQAEAHSESVSHRVIHREINEKVKALINKLPPVECRLINLVYFEGYTLQDAASMMGYSKSWASRLHTKILESLASDMRRLDLHDF